MINLISVKLPSQLIISKVTTPFDENFDQLSMNSINEVTKFKPGQTFENTNNDIKDNHLKCIASATMNISATTLLEENFKNISMNSSIEVAKFEPGQTFENNINEIKDNHLKIIAYATS